MSSNLRRVLFIAYLFPPIANSGTRRSLSFVNHLPDHGWQPTVLTVANPPVRVCDPSLLAEVRKGTPVERAPLGSQLAARAVAGCLPAGRGRAGLTAAIEWRLARLAQAPDEVVSWYPTAVRHGLRLHKEHGFDLIYASGWPWTSFLVARAIGLKTGLPYLLDYRDLWRPTGTHAWEVQTRLQRVANPSLERFAARHAAAVVTVTPTLAKDIMRDAAVPHVHCITNGFEPADFPTRMSSPDAGVGLIHVSYTGVWRPGYGLVDLYRALQRMKTAGSPCISRLRVHAAGFTPGPAREFGVDDIVQELGHVPHEHALSLMNGADALYLPVPLGYYSTASLPGKLFEYLGSGRPILAVVPEGSEVARVVREVGGALRIEPGDVAALAHALERLCTEQSVGIFGTRQIAQIQRYTRSTTTREMSEVFELALRGQARG